MRMLGGSGRGAGGVEWEALFELRCQGTLGRVLVALDAWKVLRL